jgi:hypothetical protein
LQETARRCVGCDKHSDFGPHYGFVPAGSVWVSNPFDKRSFLERLQQIFLSDQGPIFGIEQARQPLSPNVLRLDMPISSLIDGKQGQEFASRGGWARNSPCPHEICEKRR